MSNKRSRKMISILITLTMLVTLLVPMVGPASASTSYSMTSVNKIKADFPTSGSSSQIGFLSITMDSSSVLASAGKYVYFDLPSSPTGYKIFPNKGTGNLLDADNKTISNCLGQIAGATVTFTNGFTGTGADIQIVKKSETQFAVYVKNINSTSTHDTSKDSMISIPLFVKVPAGISGEVTLSASAQSSSTFTSGTVTIARIGASSVTLASESVPTITSGSSTKLGVIDIKEDSMGSLLNTGSTGTYNKTSDVNTDKSEGSYALKLTLPPGFSWTSQVMDFQWGDNDFAGNKYFNWSKALKLSNDGRELDISVRTLKPYTEGTVDTELGSGKGSNSATFLKLTSNVSVDESIAKSGDIVVTVSGAVSSSPTTMVVGRYGEYGTSVKAASSVDLIAGKVAEDVGKIEIDETVPNSLIPDRTITLTLPDNVRWSQFPTIDADNSSNYGSIGFTWGSVGTDGKMIKGTISGNTSNGSDPAKIVLKNMQVTSALDFSGDLKVAVAGSEGLSGDLVIGNAKAAVTAKASATPDVKIGMAGQAIGDITITENMAEAINGTMTIGTIDSTSKLVSSSVPSSSTGTFLVLEAPAGVTFDGTPTVEVTDGDLQISANAVSTTTSDANEGLLKIKIKSSSTKASTIKISNIKLTVNRTIPEGALKLELKGNAINEAVTDTDELFAGHDSAASFAVATCVTPAPVDNKSTTVFKIGDTKYTVNGNESTLDAAPYIKNDRTYLPIRFVAKALGVADSNIMWNADEQSVVMVKGDRVVKLVIGSTNMLINGVAVTMDAAPEVVDPGRTMLPVRWVAQALGANIQWDAATQTVTIN